DVFQGFGTDTAIVGMAVLGKPAAACATAASPALVLLRFAQQRLRELLGQRHLAYAGRPLKQDRVRQALAHLLQLCPCIVLPRIEFGAHLLLPRKRMLATGHHSSPISSSSRCRMSAMDCDESMTRKRWGISAARRRY